MTARSFLKWLFFAGPALAALSIFLSACDDGATTAPTQTTITPESYLAKTESKWYKMAYQPYSITFREWDIDGTTYFDCHASHGMIDSCQRTYHPSGDETEHSVVREHESPGDIMAHLYKNLKSLRYDSAAVTDTGFTATRKLGGVGDDGQPIRIGIFASFDTTYGYPKQIVYAGEVLPWSAEITAFQLD
jgi:hypothetical protein